MKTFCARVRRAKCRRTSAPGPAAHAPARCAETEALFRRVRLETRACASQCPGRIPPRECRWHSRYRGDGRKSARGAIRIRKFDRLRSSRKGKLPSSSSAPRYGGAAPFRIAPQLTKLYRRAQSVRFAGFLRLSSGRQMAARFAADSGADGPSCADISLATLSPARGRADARQRDQIGSHRCRLAGECRVREGDAKLAADQESEVKRWFGGSCILPAKFWKAVYCVRNRMGTLTA